MTLNKNHSTKINALALPQKYRIAAVSLILAAVCLLVGLMPAKDRAWSNQAAPSIKFTVLHGGNRYGKVESCGCATIKAGGIDREAKLLADIRQKAQNVLIFEPGGLLPPNVRPDLDAVKLDYLYQIMAHMKFDAINIGPGELKLGLERLQQLQAETGAPLVSANVVDAAGKQVFAPYRLITITDQAGGKATVGVTGITALRHMVSGDVGAYDKLSRMYKSPFAPHREKLAAALAELKTKCDVTVVLFDGGMYEGQYLAEKYQPDILIANDRLKLEKPKKIGRTFFRTYGLQGKYLAQMDFQSEGAKGLSLLAAKVSTILESHPFEQRAHQLVEEFKQALGQANTTGARPKLLARGDYQGADTCLKCHETQHSEWLLTTHATVYDQLAQQVAELAETQLARVVTGWECPEGFMGLEETPFLLNVQCEVCHGPGRAHNEAENVNFAFNSFRKRFPDRKFVTRPRVMMETQIKPELCASCHPGGFPGGLDFAAALKANVHSHKTAKK